MGFSLDTFQRPNQDGWGIATDGHQWQDDRAEHPGAIVAIQQGCGYVDTLTAGTDLDQWMGENYTNALISADFLVYEFWRGHPQRCARLLGRVRDGHHFLVFACNFGNSTLQLWVNSNEQWRMLQEVHVHPFSTQQWYHAQLLLRGSDAFGKVWQVGTAEPDWQITGRQQVLVAGMGGLRTTYSRVSWANFQVREVPTSTGQAAT